MWAGQHFPIGAAPSTLSREVNFVQTTKRCTRRVAAVVSVFMLGCFGDCSSSIEGEGELGNTAFFYNCTSLTDAACFWNPTGLIDDVPGGSDGFPDCIAVGGEFRLDSGDSEEFLEDNVEPASPELVSGDNPFRAEQVGRVAMVARGSNSVITDLIHIEVVEPASIDFGNIGAAVDLEEDETRIVRVTPVDSTCPALGGALELSATSSNPEVVEVSTRGLMALEAVGPGEATITVQLGTMTRDLDVTVEGDVPSTTTTTTTSGGATASTGATTETSSTGGA